MHLMIICHPRIYRNEKDDVRSVALEVLRSLHEPVLLIRSKSCRP